MPLARNEKSHKTLTKKKMGSNKNRTNSSTNNGNTTSVSKRGSTTSTQSTVALQNITVINDARIDTTARGLLTDILLAFILLGVAISCFLLVSGYFYNYIDTTVQRQQSPFTLFVEAFSSLQMLGNYIMASFYNLLTVIFHWCTRGIRIVHFIDLLDTHFPGAILGFPILLLVVILLILFGLKFYRLSNTYTECVVYKQKLQKKLEDTEIQLQEESRKVKEQDIQNCEKVKETEKLHLKSKKLKEINSNYKKEKDQRLCPVCQDQERTILLLPCQHMCLCKQCLKKKKWKQCPICRQVIQSTKEIYI